MTDCEPDRLIDDPYVLRSQRNFWMHEAMAIAEHANSMRLALLEHLPAMLEQATPPTLTEMERAAIAWAAGLSDTRPSGCRTTLRSLLERASKSTADVRESDQ